MGKKNITSKFIRKKIIFIRKNLGKNKAEVDKAKKVKRDILPFGTAKNESKGYQKCDRKSKIKDIEENYSKISKTISKEKPNQNNHPNGNKKYDKIKAKLPMSKANSNGLRNESNKTKEKNYAIQEKKIPIDKSIKPHISENNNTNRPNEKACSINDNKRTKVRPYNYSGRNEEQKNLLVNSNGNTKNIKIKENSKKTHLEENKKNKNESSGISLDNSSDESYTSERDSESGLQEQMILKEKQIEEEELAKSIRHKQLKEISLEKIRVLFEKEEYSLLKEYSFPYMRFGQFCYRIYKIKLRNFRKLYFYCPICGKIYKNYSIPFHIFQFHFKEREQYLTTREIAKGCANCWKRNSKK